MKLPSWIAKLFSRGDDQPKRGEGPFILERSDGCSGLSIPYRWVTGTILRRERKLSFLDHCIEHDEAYWYGGTWQQRREADDRLFLGVKNQGESWYGRIGYFILACPMWIVPRMIGSPRLPTPFRWMRGVEYTKGLQYTTDRIEKHETVETELQAEIVTNIMESEYLPEYNTVEEAVEVVVSKEISRPSDEKVETVI